MTGGPPAPGKTTVAPANHFKALVGPVRNLTKERTFERLVPLTRYIQDLIEVRFAAKVI
jgi:hypothetical protein